MATAAYSKVVKLSTASGGTYDVCDGLNDASVSLAGEVLDDTCFSTSHPGYRSRMLGLLDSSISLSGDYSTGAGQAKLFTSWVNRAPIWVQYLPTGSTSGNGFQTSYVVESYEIAGGIGDKNTFSASLQADSTGITQV